MDKVLNSYIKDLDATIMAIYSTLVSKAAAFRLYFNKSLSNLDLDNNSSKGSSTYDATPKLNIMEVYISGTPVIYTKV